MRLLEKRRDLEKKMAKSLASPLDEILLDSDLQFTKLLIGQHKTLAAPLNKIFKKKNFFFSNFKDAKSIGLFLVFCQ